MRTDTGGQNAERHGEPSFPDGADAFSTFCGKGALFMLKRLGGHSMPRRSQMPLTAKNHEDGNNPRTTAFETAVRPTPTASAISRRPTRSASFAAVVS